MKGLKVLETAGLFALLLSPTAAEPIGASAGRNAASPDVAASPTPAPAPRRLPAPEAVWLNGKPFPQVVASAPHLSAAHRTFFAEPGTAAGDGSEAAPWSDLQAALRQLQPGDRLRVRAGEYSVALQIDESCQNGTRQEPIQIVFDGKAELTPNGDSAILTITRAHWVIVGLYAKLSDSKAPAVSIEGAGSHDVMLEQVRISGGKVAAVFIGAASQHVTIDNSRISKEHLEEPGRDAVGVRIAAGARNILLRNNHLHENPAGSVRIDAPARSGLRARDIQIVDNTISGDGSTAIAVAAADGLRITGNTISDATGGDTRCLTLDDVRRAVVRSNHFSHCALAMRIGQVDPDAGVRGHADDVSIDHNFLESALPGGTAVDIEAGEGVRFANNVIQGYSDGITVFGKPPSTKGVTIANNLWLSVSRTAFMIQDPQSADLFDYNVFSPQGEILTAEVGHNSLPLTQFLKEGTMPHTRVVPNVQVLNRDLGRISGVETANRGTAIEGIGSHAGAPALGVAER
jgi:hypothetical protein